MTSYLSKQNTRLNLRQASGYRAELQDKALVWKAARGVYALEDSFLADLMQQAGMLSA